MSTFEIEVVSVKADRTKSGDPMWRCTTKSGETVNIFLNRNPDKDTFSLVKRAGYGDLFAGMKQGEIMTWRRHPIRAAMFRNGEWFNLFAVAPRPADADPDPVFAPDAAKQRAKAIRWARSLLDIGFGVVDTETTGLGPDDEIVSIALTPLNSGVAYHKFIRPTDPAKLTATAESVHGISTDKLISAPTLSEVAGKISAMIAQCPIWAGYNIAFDMKMIERSCQLAGIEPFVFPGTTDVMQIVAEYRGEWDAEQQRWKVCTLSEAAALFGIATDDAHDAAADCLMTARVIEAVANAS